jgi:thiol-disulfide isomerase/thioredoxin
VNVNDFLDRLPLPVRSRLPELAGATAWLNSEPLTRDDLRGKVVAVDFWTYTCINWIRTLPYRRTWEAAYGAHGLVVVGVHTPEFSIEHDVEQVRRAAAGFGVEYPIAIDNRYAVWDAFANQYWPALYVADAEGRVRHQHFGEGGYDRSERVIQHLLADAGARGLPEAPVPVEPRGLELSADGDDARSPETYVGLARAVGFASPGGAELGVARDYSLPTLLRVDEWALEGRWTMGRESAVLHEAGGRIAGRFHARDVNLILAPRSAEEPVRIQVRVDGRAPHDSHGLDVDGDGDGIVTEPRLHQLLRHRPPVSEHVLDVELRDPGAAAFCFTFG